MLCLGRRTQGSRAGLKSATARMVHEDGALINIRSLLVMSYTSVTCWPSKSRKAASECTRRKCSRLTRRLASPAPAPSTWFKYVHYHLDAVPNLLPVDRLENVRAITCLGSLNPRPATMRQSQHDLSSPLKAGSLWSIGVWTCCACQAWL